MAVNLALTGCATTTPYTGIGPHPQIERGHAIPPLDALGNVFGAPAKLILWDWRVDRHSVSPQIEAVLVGYLARMSGAARDAKFRLNEYGNPYRVRRGRVEATNLSLRNPVPMPPCGIIV